MFVGNSELGICLLRLIYHGLVGFDRFIDELLILGFVSGHDIMNQAKNRSF